jgi:MSHA biogenesis protein MshG
VPQFSYRGRSGSGQEVSGVLDGATAAAIADALFAQGVTPLDIRPAATSQDKPASAPIQIKLFAPKVQHTDLLLFSRQLYTLLKSGVPIMRALSGLQESSSNPAMRDVLQTTRESLDAGRELSVSLARSPKVFSAFYLSMVRVGEMTGRLEEIFLRLFDHLEFERFMREQVKSALRYPMFVTIAMVVALFVVNMWVVPAFAQVYRGFGAELPFMTRVLIGFSDFMVAWWHVLLIGLAGAVFGFRWYIGTPAGKYWWDRTALRIPIAGQIVRKATLSRFARSFALATKSGVPIIQALTTVAQTVDNAYIADKVAGMRNSVERGESMLRAAIGTGVFTPVVLQMIAVGEETGALDDLMEEIAEMYQREVEYDLKTLSQNIEPVLIVMLGALVLVLALGIFLPIWDLGKAAMHK